MGSTTLTLALVSSSHYKEAVDYHSNSAASLKHMQAYVSLYKMVRHARIELASQPWQGRVFNQHTHAAKWRIAKVPPPMPALAGHHPISSRRSGLPELTIHKVEERKGLAPLECLSTPYNLSKIAPRLAGLSPNIPWLTGSRKKKPYQHHEVLSTAFFGTSGITSLFLLVSVLKTTQRDVSNSKNHKQSITHDD